MRRRSLLPSVEFSPRDRWAAVCLVAGAILLVSAIPIPGSVPEDGGGVPTSVLFHFLGYATLALVLSFALLVRGRPVRANALAFVGASGYGALIEYVQYPIPYRTFSYLDMAINAGGALLGVLLVAVVLARSE